MQIPRIATHKRNPTQVLVHRVERAGPDLYVVDAAIPRGHGATAGCDRLTLTAVIELLRQAGYAAMHVFRDQPYPTAYLLDRAAFTFAGDAPALPRWDGYEGRVLVRISPAGKRAAEFEFTHLTRDGGLVGTGACSARMLTPAEYTAIRRSAAPFEERRDDILLAHGTELGWDTYDAFYFDHPVDHVPGILFVGATERLTGPLRGAEFTFPAFAELDEPVAITRDGDEIRFVQGDRDVARAKVARA